MAAVNVPAEQSNTFAIFIHTTSGPCSLPTAASSGRVGNGRTHVITNPGGPR